MALTGFEDLDALVEKEPEVFNLVVFSNSRPFSEFLFGKIQTIYSSLLSVLTERVGVHCPYVDCFTWSGVPPLPNRPRATLGGPSALNNLAMLLSESKEKTVVFFTFSPFLVYNKETTIDPFLRSITEKAKNQGRSLVFFCDPDLISSTAKRMMETRADLILKARGTANKVKIRLEPLIPLEVEAEEVAGKWRLV